MNDFFGTFAGVRLKYSLSPFLFIFSFTEFENVESKNYRGKTEQSHFWGREIKRESFGFIFLKKIATLFPIRYRFLQSNKSQFKMQGRGRERERFETVHYSFVHYLWQSFFATFDCFSFSLSLSPALLKMYIRNLFSPYIQEATFADS